jgi:alpha-L-rhamnosidase
MACPPYHAKSVRRWVDIFYRRYALRNLFFIAILFIILCMGAFAENENSMTPIGLKCEYHVNPMGIHEKNPRFSWLFVGGSAQRGKRQTAYQIMAATTREKLENNDPDLWDTKKITSDQTCQIPYDGAPLKSRMQCFWKVRSWDENGTESPWSETAFFTMGLLENKDWKADWIGYDAEREPISHPVFHGLSWIWFPEGNPQNQAPRGNMYFRRSFTIPENKKIAKASIDITVDNRFDLYLNENKVGNSKKWEEYSSFDLRPFLKPGKNTLAVDAFNNEPGAAGLIAKISIEFEKGDPIILTSCSDWKTSDSASSKWASPEYDDSAWKPAMKIAVFPSPPWGNLASNDLHLPPAPFLRTSFSCNKNIRRATAYSSALGLYELYINGKRIGKDYFSPGWTDYNKRIYYNTHDVASALKQGKNAIGAIVADGWYSGYYGFHRRRNHYGDKPRFLLQLEIEYDDGSAETITSNKNWKASCGPFLEADLLMGETYDGRKEISGWDLPGFNDSSWKPVSTGIPEGFSPILENHPGNPVRLIEEIQVKTISEPNPGVFVFDLAQNMVGVVRIKVKGKPGQPITLRYAERLNPDGTIYTQNLRGARATDTYFPKSASGETWSPRFTFHGFQYVEITGLPDKPPLGAVTGLVLHSDMQRTGDFECSEPLVNRLFQNILWGQKGNYLEVPTDCPQRDERLGWTGDAQVFIPTGIYNMDIAAFFTKWMKDMEDAQLDNGCFADVAPRLDVGGGSPAWADAGIVCPYTIYESYGDVRILERNYVAMTRYMNFLENRAKDFLQPSMGYGDWLSTGANTPKEVIATAYYAYSANLMSKIAGALGKTGDVEKYKTLFENIKSAFNNAYVSEKSHIKGRTQTDYLLALVFDLLPEEKRSAALDHLIGDIKERDVHLSSGFVGTRHALPILSQMDHNDLAHQLLLTETFPSWLFQVKNGATTIWERWDGWTPEKGFQNPGMNSFNHYAFGCVGEWIYGYVLGIQAEEPGYKKIVIRPRPSKRFSYAKGHYDSINGRIAVSWRIEGKAFHLDVEIPTNTTAIIYIPAGEHSTILEDGKPAAESEGVTFLRKEKDAMAYKLGSGSYSFVSHLE